MCQNLNNDTKVSAQFYDSFFPDKHSVEAWESDQSRKVIVNGSSNAQSKTEKDEVFFSRFPFFSGRLGFREYDLSATAALQVLVAGSALEWNVINYTHEIIHNHVRIILEPLIQPYESTSEIKNWLNEKLVRFEKFYKKQINFEELTYGEYFSFLIISYCVNSEYFGALSRRFSPDKYNTYLTSGNNTRILKLPNIEELLIRLRSLYRDISEIFVHVLDFSYVYVRNLDIYVKSIWCSWSRVSTVLSNLDHYVLRTLLIFSLKEKGTSYERFDESVKRFKEFLSKNAALSSISCVAKSINEILSSANDDFRQRFINAVIIADLADQFFVAKVETDLNYDDERVLPRGTLNAPVYELETGEFVDANIKSKIRFIYDQLNRTVNSGEESATEYTSAWLLLTLSSYNS
jgi:hypothetical protein